MSNYSIKIDLLKIEGAFKKVLKGKTTSKECICIPLDALGLYNGKQGVYLSLAAIELKTSKYEDTHGIKVQLTKEQRDTLGEEKSRQLPFVGGLHAFPHKGQNPLSSEFGGSSEWTEVKAAATNQIEEDLPF